jgi:hypothetical protein
MYIGKKVVGKTTSQEEVFAAAVLNLLQCKGLASRENCRENSF